MPEKDQYDDLKKLISLSAGRLSHEFESHVYEPPLSVLGHLFRIARDEKLNDRKRRNLTVLMKIALEELETEEIPEWLLGEIEKFLDAPSFTDEEKTIVISAFEADELIGKVRGYEEFIERVFVNPPDIEEFLINNIRDNPSRLADIYETMLAESSPEGLIVMIDDLTGSGAQEVLDLLELLVYHSDPAVSRSALHAIEQAENQEAIRTLYSISRLHPGLRREAERMYINLMHEVPLPDEGPFDKEDQPSSETGSGFLDMKISLVDGNGALSAFFGKRMARNSYFYASILFKFDTGIKDVMLISNLDRAGYNDIRREYLAELPFYSATEDYLKRLLRHFLWLGEKKGEPFPRDFITLKNIMNWRDLEPMEYEFEFPELEPLRYRVDDLFHFPMETWWMDDRKIYNILSPYRGSELKDLPEEVVAEVLMEYLGYLQEKILPYCELSADIVLNSLDKKKSRRLRLLLSIRDELLGPPERLYNSSFLNFGMYTTIDHVLHNLSIGAAGPEPV